MKLNKVKKHQVKLSWREHNSIFTNHRNTIMFRYEVFDDPQKHDLEVYKYVRLPARVVVTLISPIAILFGGIPSMVNLWKECWSGGHVGAFTVAREWFHTRKLFSGVHNDF